MHSKRSADISLKRGDYLIARVLHVGWWILLHDPASGPTLICALSHTPVTDLFADEVLCSNSYQASVPQLYVTDKF